LVLFIFLIFVFEAYSVYVALQESSIQPLPLRESIQYIFSKQGGADMYVEVRSIALNIIDETVTSVEVGWYRKLRGQFSYEITITVVVRDDSGNQISSGYVKQCYRDDILDKTIIYLSPAVEIGSIAVVDASASIGKRCS
ncbi:MAG: hypothetical protein QW095_01055, partial [Nitrososphaerota archaeon]